MVVLLALVLMTTERPISAKAVWYELSVKLMEFGLLGLAAWGVQYVVGEMVKDGGSAVFHKIQPTYPSYFD